ncbi:MAG: phosphate signaling complex protein PhoU [Candidatus Omnitrophota bacterium]|nr:phosphate signaling complex protein PhoU [Candidatus Omnitrophota bacterium]MBU1929378.1 phosphate signaling complex protein PhoU [Candidatus Omnitrophota bacterium]MBU2034882.1 phosphate signaling complex protein PhoU [Candidatus Omnitrophota bacterium]MBU2222219.1 phosphate signaling complex protein PhoU [Candidatus Omnitrophota bacterium]MBU2258207.1 phosphate signaling complex protein PhoU [Candidatus Omnitrophota bacterium]
MERHFDEELKELHKGILRMGAMAQEAIFKSTEALKSWDKNLAQGVIDADDKIDTLELSIDELCIDLIARHQPMATDLRLITTGMKINAELERIADLAVDISQRVLELVDKPLLKPLVDIPKLSFIAQEMVKGSIDAFVKKDAGMARKVVLSDAQADELRNLVQKELVEDYMVKDGKTADRAVPLLLISRHLERICDHATNIAEDVIYLVEAKVVKHHPEELS